MAATQFGLDAVELLMAVLNIKVTANRTVKHAHLPWKTLFRVKSCEINITPVYNAGFYGEIVNNRLIEVILVPHPQIKSNPDDLQFSKK